MAGHAQLKFVMTECSKTQIRLTGPSLIWVCTVCPDLSVRKLRIIMVMQYMTEPGHEKTCLMLYANNKGAD